MRTGLTETLLLKDPKLNAKTKPCNVTSAATKEKVGATQTTTRKGGYAVIYVDVFYDLFFPLASGESIP